MSNISLDILWGTWSLRKPICEHPKCERTVLGALIVFAFFPSVQAMCLDPQSRISNMCMGHTHTRQLAICDAPPQALRRLFRSSFWIAIAAIQASLFFSCRFLQHCKLERLQGPQGWKGMTIDVISANENTMQARTSPAIGGFGLTPVRPGGDSICRLLLGVYKPISQWNFQRLGGSHHLIASTRYIFFFFFFFNDPNYNWTKPRYPTKFTGVNEPTHDSYQFQPPKTRPKSCRPGNDREKSHRTAVLGS